MSTDCVLCGSKKESQNHLFFACQFSDQIWGTLMSKLLSGNYSTEWDRLVIHLYNSNYDKLKQFLLRYVFQAIVYHIWRERNNCRHGEAPFQATCIIKLVDKNVRNRLSSIHLARYIFYNDGMVMWLATQIS